ncbi:uncharacterized protein EMH_0056230 [Eimeria mitis]|uniref:Uncharacterized protein n=1 Tax=Eimeria mitis TaxID=44415 RepID=U6KEH0_9EIME|nr:uncharacterized protein EMH_0056230 [Eimeria mitis]CDJ33848.1 hypothetical protein, conserved [Eimeria mitis]
MGIFFRDREEDLADPDLRASRYFLFKNKQTKENKLKVAEKKYGYTLGELHAYKHVMIPPRMPERMEQAKPEMAYAYDQIQKLVATEVYEQQTENHFATMPPQTASKGYPPIAPSATAAYAASSNAKSRLPEEGDGANGPNTVDESCIKCLGYYLALDRCVRAVSKQDEKNRIYKHTRLHACKPHWIWFNRCVSYRDRQLLREIHSWEAEHVSSLGPKQREEYVERLLGTKRYLEYAAARSRDEVDVVRLKREASHIIARLDKLNRGNCLDARQREDLDAA